MVIPAYAGDNATQTGISGVGPASFILMLAAALLLTLIFRSTATCLAGMATATIGRWRIRAALAKRGSNVLHDFILPGAYGGLVKLDHVIVSAGGIICIQAKHYNGVILGSGDDAQWTNIDGISRRRFLNPLIQNEGRFRALQKIAPDVPVTGIVIFTGSVEFTTPPGKNVIQIGDLERYLEKVDFDASKIKDWDAAWLAVTSAAMTDAHTRKDLQAQLSFS